MASLLALAWIGSTQLTECQQCDPESLSSALCVSIQCAAAAAAQRLCVHAGVRASCSALWPGFCNAAQLPEHDADSDNWPACRSHSQLQRPLARRLQHQLPAVRHHPDQQAAQCPCCPLGGRAFPQRLPQVTRCALKAGMSLLPS